MSIALQSIYVLICNATLYNNSELRLIILIYEEYNFHGIKRCIAFLTNNAYGAIC